MTTHYRVDLDYDEDGTVTGLWWEEFEQIKETPCGYWVTPAVFRNVSYLREKNKKFILRKSRKKYCHPTKEEALQAFIHRKRREIFFAEHRLVGAREGILLAQDELGLIKQE